MIGRGALLLAVFGSLSPQAIGASGATVTGAAARIGSWGLEVSIGRDCSVTDTVEINGGSGTIEGLYEACLQVTAEGVSTTGAGAILRAGEQVVLGEDFSVAAGTMLTVEIAPAMAKDFWAVLDRSPIDEAVYHASFYVDLSGLSFGAGAEIRHFAAYSETETNLFSLILEPAAGGAALLLAARQDGGGSIRTAPGQEIPLAGGWTRLEVDWSAGAGTGRLLISVDDGPFIGLTGLDNDSHTVESVRWGAVDGLIATSSGFLRLDGFNSWR